MAGLNQMTEQAKQFWATRTNNQRLVLGLGAAATVGLLAVFANMMMVPDYKPLMTGLETADAQTIQAELSEKKIPFKLSADGKTISVPADQVDAARLSVASSQSTRSGRLGFELFDKVSWGQTEFDEKVNYQRALEGELERTIMTLGGVKSARVHLVMETQSVFIDRERGAKASVTLKLNRGGLSHDETMSIQRLVAGAVDGLKPTDVQIIDADSNKSLGATGEGDQGEEGVERQLTQRLTTTLAPVLGQDHLRASVNVEYDQGSSEVSQDQYDPSVVVPLSVQKSKETSGSGVGGVAGTSSNVPKAPVPNVPTPTGADDGSTSTTENTTYGVNRTTTHLIEPAGRIKRITAALVVDDFVKRKLGSDGKWAVTRMKRSPQELQQIETLAASAIGIDTKRGDTISVQNLSFETPDDVDVPVPTLLDKAKKDLAGNAQSVKYGMMVLLFLLAYVLMIRPVQKKVFTDVEVPKEPLALQAPEMLAELEPPSPEVTKQLVMRERLVEHVKQDPVKSARVVQAWLRGAGE
jgi:flagellar M-ring protein FliF